MNQYISLQVENDYMHDAVTIFLRDDRGPKVVLYGMDNGEMIAQTLEPGLIPEKPLLPLLRMRGGMYTMFIDAMANHLSGKNIKTENENHLAGKLAATEKHLEDLRGHFDLLLKKVVS